MTMEDREFRNNECRQSQKYQKRRKNVQTTATDQHAQRREQHDASYTPHCTRAASDKPRSGWVRSFSNGRPGQTDLLT